MFAQKADGKREYFASRLHEEFIKDYICDDIDECINRAIKLEDPEIFVDRGWGDMPLAISLINDGDGQFPYIFFTKKVFDKLVEKKYLSENILSTYKARKLYKFYKNKINSYKETIINLNFESNRY